MRPTDVTLESQFNVLSAIVSPFPPDVGSGLLYSHWSSIRIIASCVWLVNLRALRIMIAFTEIYHDIFGVCPFRHWTVNNERVQSRWQIGCIHKALASSENFVFFVD